MERKFILDYETVDNITKHNLHEIRNSIQFDLEEAARGNKWMHEEDVENYSKNILPALDVLLKFFGMDGA